MSLNDLMKQLADGTRQRFNVTGQLGLKDMIKIITPPKGKLLIKPGEFKFTTSPSDKTTITTNGGTTISGTTYIVPSFYSEVRKLLDNPSSRPDLTLRLHFNVVSTDGSEVMWSVYGAGSIAKWRPNNSSTSDYHLASGLLVDEHNGLQFQTTGQTVIDLANSYVEILGG